ncbi:hypothetical protein Sjap_017665 [Stephania japonica]|uniref:Uncharacterized protein n=1 Tax=Stephania japonica TaxID=461633 RepID=A0AAP0I6N6_9MAGN
MFKIAELYYYFVESYFKCGEILYLSQITLVGCLFMCFNFLEIVFQTEDFQGLASSSSLDSSEPRKGELMAKSNIHQEFDGILSDYDRRHELRASDDKEKNWC